MCASALFTLFDVTKLQGKAQEEERRREKYKCHMHVYCMQINDKHVYKKMFHNKNSEKEKRACVLLHPLLQLSWKCIIDKPGAVCTYHLSSAFDELFTTSAPFAFKNCCGYEINMIRNYAIILIYFFPRPEP